MRKESQHYEINENLCLNTKRQCQEATKKFGRLKQIKSKNDFLDWLKSLPFQIRYLAVKVEAPGLAQTIRQTLRRLQSKSENSEIRKATNKNQKNILDFLVFTSDGKQFYDSICFDFNFIEHPERLYDLLMYNGENIKKFNPIQQMQKNRRTINQSCQEIKLAKSKEDLCKVLIRTLRHEIFFNTCNKQQLEINSQKNRKKQLSFFWRNLSEELKQKILYIGKNDLKSVTQLLIQRNIIVSAEQLQKQITNLIKLEKNEFCNRIFKCKLKKSLSPLTDYHELIYKIWKTEYEKFRKIKVKRTNNFSLMKNIGSSKNPQQKIERNKLKQQNKLNNRNFKQNSTDSFQTNQTEIYEKLEETVIKNKNNKESFLNDFIQKKIYANLVQFSTFIAQQANFFHKARLIAFQRIKFILQYYGIPIKLFGSCANGIAIKNSDIDIAIDNSIVNYFPYCEGEQKVKASLQWLETVFTSFKCMKNIKLIKTAAIPIIKLSLDTNQLFELDQNCFTFDISEYSKYLNRSHNCSVIQIDITVETHYQNLKCNHLGINTTKRINQWMNQIKPLKYIVIMMKYFLSVEDLNSTYKDGINTYGIVVILVAVVKYLNLQKEDNIVVMLEKILYFLIHQFDQKTHGIDLRNKKQIFYKKEESQKDTKIQFTKADLEILDPQNKGHNMTKKCYKYDLIKELFQRILKQCFLIPRKQITSSFLKDKKLSHANIQNQKLLKKESLSQITQRMTNPFMRLVQQKAMVIKSCIQFKQEQDPLSQLQLKQGFSLLRTDSISG